MAAPKTEIKPTRGASRRLKETIRSRKLSSLHSGVLERLMWAPPQSKDVSEREWIINAKLAFPAEQGETLKNVFTFFKLDPNDPWAWRSLAGHWADLLFGSSEPGRRVEWTETRLCKLIREVGLRKQRKPDLSERAICGHIADDPRSPAYLQELTAGGIRKALERARTEKHNGFLRRLVARIVDEDKSLTRAKARARAIAGIEGLSELDRLEAA